MLLTRKTKRDPLNSAHSFVWSERNVEEENTKEYIIAGHLPLEFIFIPKTMYFISFNSVQFQQQFRMFPLIYNHNTCFIDAIRINCCLWTRNVEWARKERKKMRKKKKETKKIRASIWLESHAWPNRPFTIISELSNGRVEKSGPSTSNVAVCLFHVRTNTNHADSNPNNIIVLFVDFASG